MFGEVHRPNPPTYEIILVAAIAVFSITAKLDEHMKSMSNKMKASPGLFRVTRQVCKAEWAYELSFVWGSKENYGAWKESDLQKEVHAIYQSALEDCGIKEADVYAGARVVDDF